MKPALAFVPRRGDIPDDDDVHFCKRAGCIYQAPIGQRYCSAACWLADPARPRPVVLFIPVARTCGYDPRHAYRVRPDDVDSGYCRPACAAAAARIAARRERREAVG